MISLLALLWLQSATAAPPCALTAPEGAVVKRSGYRAEDVRLVITIWVEQTPTAELEALLAVLDARQVHTALLLRDNPAPEVAAVLRPALALGHELVLLGEVRSYDHRDDAETAHWRELKKAAKSMEKSIGVRPKSFAGVIPTRVSEAVVAAGGFPTMLPMDRPPSATHTQSGRFEGTINPPVTLPRGPYRAEICSGSPEVAGFNPAIADRLSRAITTASGTTPIPVVQLGLHGLSQADIASLAGWLDEVGLPSGVRIQTPSALRLDLIALDARASTVSEPTGRRVTVEAVNLAARHILTAGVLPRELQGDLNPTEAFMALLELAADPEQAKASSVRLRPMGPPVELARSSLSGSVSIPRDQVQAVAKGLLAAPPKQLPNAVPVDGTLLNAPELLVLLASSLIEDTPTARPIRVADPSAAGIGWGRSGVAK